MIARVIGATSMRQSHTRSVDGREGCELVVRGGAWRIRGWWGGARWRKWGTAGEQGQHLHLQASDTFDVPCNVVRLLSSEVITHVSASYSSHLFSPTRIRSVEASLVVLNLNTQRRVSSLGSEMSFTMASNRRWINKVNAGAGLFLQREGLHGFMILQLCVPTSTNASSVCAVVLRHGSRPP